MPNRSAEYFDPFTTAERGRSYQGKIPLGQLDRLIDSILDDRGEVSYTLNFVKEDKVYAVTGKIRSDLYLECSVCLGKLTYPVEAHPKLGLVSSLDETALLPEVYEPLLVVDRQLRIQDVIEEELLLSIPIHPRHEECRMMDHPDQPPLYSPNNPFSILASLKLRGDQ